jgi:hypothetical protein
MKATRSANIQKVGAECPETRLSSARFSIDAKSPMHSLSVEYRECMVRRATARGVWSKRQVCANVFGLWLETSSPGHDELRACPSF